MSNMLKMSIFWNDFFQYLFYENYNYMWLFNVFFWLGLSIFIFRIAITYDLLVRTKNLYLKYSIFFLAYAVSKSIFFFSNYYHDRLGVSAQESILLRIGYTINMIAVTSLIFGLEKNLFNWKGYITAIAFLNTCIILFAPEHIYKSMTMYLQPLYFLTMLKAYVEVLRKTVGVVRNYALKTVIGMTLFFIGVFLDLRIIKDYFTSVGLESFIYIFIPLINLVGSVIFLRSVPTKNRRIRF